MPRALVDRLSPLRDRFVSSTRPLALVVLILSVLALGTGWVFASSPGSSPDDDYHLVSTWCPRPVESSCETTTIDGDLYVIVPMTASRAQCEAFRPDASHACIDYYSDDTLYPSYRYDDGQYPIGFYHFHHLLAGHSVEASAWHMRAVNVAILLVLLGATIALSRRDIGATICVAALVAWTPMGLYFIASNNPSSWAITGVFTYGAALYAALHVQKWRRWPLLVIATIAAVLCYASRGDAAFYVFVASLGILVLSASRHHLPEIGVATVLSAIGVWMMLGSGQANNVAQNKDATVPLHDRIDIAIRNVRYLPEYFAGFVGLNSGPGWRDTPLPGYAPILGLLVLGFVLFLGVRLMTWRKALAAILVFGALAGIPLLIATPAAFPNLGGYHSRYALPLLGTWLLIWISSALKNSMLSRGQLTMFVLFLSVVNAVALHTTIARYTQGLEYVEHMGWIARTNLNSDVQWWWADMPLRPMSLWFLASAGYAIASVCALYLLRAPHQESDTNTNRQLHQEEQ